MEKKRSVYSDTLRYMLVKGIEPLIEDLYKAEANQVFPNHDWAFDGIMFWQCRRCRKKSTIPVKAECYPGK